MTPLRILFCDDRGGALEGFRRRVAEPLADRVEATTVSSLEGFEALPEDDHVFDVVVSDLNFEHAGGGPKDGLELLRRARRRWPDTEILLVTAFSGSLSAEETLELAQAGLTREHLLRKTAGDPDQLWELLRERIEGILQSRQTLSGKLGDLERERFFHRARALEQTVAWLARTDVTTAAREIRGSERSCRFDLVGQSYGMQELLRKLERAARRESDVLILGETGTGKELVARAVHHASARRDAVFVKTDLASLSTELIPAELFGHEKGAFTGAHQARGGLIAEADGGMLFFDEIGNLSADVQAGLLRVLEDRQFRPLGADRDRSVDTVVLAATHADLEQEVAEGRFRADLLERLDVVRLQLPPLRERREDVPLLAVCFLADLRERFGVSGFSRITAPALDRLARMPWPRNVRQLRNTLERLFSEFDDDLDPVDVGHVEAVLPRTTDEQAPEKSLTRRALDGELNLSLAEIARQFGEDAVREVIRDTFLELRGPPDDETAARLFHGSKASTWRQFAFKRGLTYRNVVREQSSGSRPDPN